MALKDLITLTAPLSKTMAVKLPKTKTGKPPEVFMRWFTTDQDHFGMKTTTNPDVWYPSNLPLVKTTSGAWAVMIDTHTKPSEQQQLQLAYELPPTPPKTAK